VVGELLGMVVCFFDQGAVEPVTTPYSEPLERKTTGDKN
jgi:hypothetical protein